MRDKHRLSRTDAERERQLGEKLANEVNKENGTMEGVQTNLQNNTAAPPSNSTGSTVPLVANAAVSKSQKQPMSGRDLRLTPDTNGVGTPATKKGNSTTLPPVVPSRATRVSDGLIL